MIISLIGLSGCGKSHLASRLVTERNFTRYCCDSLIEDRLSKFLTSSSFDGIESVARWMGQPYEAGYKERQDLYLKFEAEVMNEIILSLTPDGWGMKENIVIDTSGSFIYVGEDLVRSLKARSRIIYLGVPDSDVERMFLQYIEEPKPVVWHDSFSFEPGESSEAAIKRCYPKLLASRRRLYQQYADATLLFNRAQRDRLSVRQLLTLVGAR